MAAMHPEMHLEMHLEMQLGKLMPDGACDRLRVSLFVKLAKPHPQPAYTLTRLVAWYLSSTGISMFCAVNLMWGLFEAH